MLVLPMLAQADVWIEHPQFVASGIKNNIDAGDCVYMLVSNNLSRFDKATTEIKALKSSSGLTQDIAIKQIYYNYDKQYLVVVYLNSNIDVIKSDGSVVNIPALYNYTQPGIDKTINDVTFSDGEVYISTGFGSLVLDDNTLETKRYNNYGTSVHSMIKLGSGIIAAIGDSLYYSRTTTPNKLEDFNAISMLGNRDTSVWTQKDKNGNYLYMGQPVHVNSAKLYGINDNRLFMYVSCALDSSYMKRVEINIVDDSVALTKYQYALYAYNQALLNIQPTPSGFLWNLTATDKVYFTTNSVGESYGSVNGKNNAIYSQYPSGDGQLWGLGATGLFKNSASTVLYTSNAITIDRPYWASYNPNNGLLYLTRTAATDILTGVTEEGCMTYDGVNWISGGYKWTSAVPSAVPAYITNNHSGWRPFIDLTQPSTHYVGTWYCGLAKVVNGTVVAVYDERNSPVVVGWPGYNYRCVQGYGLDSQNNLWMVQSEDLVTGGNLVNAVMVLPADKQALNNSVTAGDWYSYNIPGTIGITSSKFSSLAIGKDDVKVYTPGNYNQPIILWRGELTEEQETKRFTQAQDQFNIPLVWNSVHPKVFADSTGMVWVGGDGIFYFDPTTAFGNTLNVIRPRTSSGDIVLSGIGVTHIEVDYLNRKWISTKNNGTYLLSADGTEILQHFDTSNSPMPADLVYSSCAMGNTGKVMIITSNGVVEYQEGNSEGGSQTLGALDVYPSLVMPNFTGLVTISGVATGSTVRIADYDNNTIIELTSENNIATWDCCNNNGDRVETGTYNIFIAASGEDMPSVPQACVKVLR